MKRFFLSSLCFTLLLGCSAADRNFNPGGGGGGSAHGGGGAGGAPDGGGGSGGTPSAGGGGAGGGSSRKAYLPVAPSHNHFAWQNWQTAFVDKDHQPCTGSISIAASDRAFCFVGKDRAVHCAGQISGVGQGPAPFSIAGVTDAVSVMVSPIGTGGDSVCVVRKNGEMMCVGDDNGAGQFGTGDTNPRIIFTRWGTIPKIEAMATGEWRELCALSQGIAWCAGARWGNVPAMVKSDLASGFWVDGNINAQPPGDVLRVAAGRSDCQITTSGFACDGLMAGMAGHIVDGNSGVYAPPPNLPDNYTRICALGDDGRVMCGRLNNGDPNGNEPYEAFVGNPVLALGMAPGETLCGVLRDGSIWCTGDNSAGQLGLDATNTPYAQDPMMVAPAGSIDTTCN